jgi:hypothetical protein
VPPEPRGVGVGLRRRAAAEAAKAAKDGREVSAAGCRVGAPRWARGRR